MLQVQAELKHATQTSYGLQTSTAAAQGREAAALATLDLQVAHLQQALRDKDRELHVLAARQGAAEQQTRVRA